MTAQETELLLVTEADRDAAAQYLRYCGKITEHSFGDMQNGKWDASEYVQAFARHRLQSLEQPKPSDAREVELVLNELRQRDADWQAKCDGWLRDLRAGDGKVDPSAEVAMRRTLYKDAADIIAALSERGKVERLQTVPLVSGRYWLWTDRGLIAAEAPTAEAFQKAYAALPSNSDGDSLRAGNT